MRVIFIILFTCYRIWGMAETPSLFFRHITTQNGLSHNNVNCILQDRHGFTWIGTNDGLSRFDGTTFRVFRHQPGSAQTISGNIIMDICEDGNGYLWIATADGGLSRYDRHAATDAQFIQYRHKPGDSTSIPVNSLNALLPDKKGHLWLATSGAGLLRFEIATGRFLKIDPSSRRTCTDICFDSNGIIWGGRQGGSYFKVDPVSLQEKSDPLYLNPYLKLPHVTITCLYLDQRKDIWMGSWDNAIYRFNNTTKAEEVLANGRNGLTLGEDEATSFGEDGSGNMWIGTKRSGLILLDPATGLYSRHYSSLSRKGALSSNSINCIYTDPQQNIWIGTDAGISFYAGAFKSFRQEYLPSLPGIYKELSVNDIMVMPDQSAWLATNAGIFMRHTSGFEYLPVSKEDTLLNVSGFFKDSNGQFYLGTDYSLFRFDPSNFNYGLLPNTSNDMVMKRIIASRIVSVEEDSINGKPALLVSPYGHYIAYYDLSSKRWISRGDSINQIISRFNLADNLIHKIYKDPKKRLWLATAKNGLAQWDRFSKQYRYHINDPSNPYSISNNHVYDMAAGVGGGLWVSTFGGGLNHFDPALNRFTYISNTPNLLEGICTDHNQRVWMIGNGQLHQYDPTEKQTRTYAFEEIESAGGVKGDIYSDQQGYLYAGGKGFYVRFHPDSIESTVSHPEVKLTDFTIFDNSFLHLKTDENQIRLDHTSNFFNIHFAAPWYKEKVYYQYMLEGVDPRWVDAGDQQVAPYTQLGGGRYRFKVRSTTVPGIWDEQATILDIIITPPFWQRWWFYLLLAVAAAGLIYLIYRYRINELLKRQEIRNRIARDLHDNMGSTLSSISIYSQVAKIYKEQQKTKELDDTLEKISGASGEMISEMNDIVWAINPRNDSMEKMLQRMESYARPLLKAGGMNFELNYPDELKHLNLNMEQRKNLYLVFKEVINNSVKYSGGSNLLVDISKSHQFLSMHIKDDGKGFDVQTQPVANLLTLSGNGLRNMQRRAAEMGGSLEITSAAGEGTRILFRFPLT